MLLQQSIEHVVVYTCNTQFVMHWSMELILVIALIQYTFHVSKNTWADQ